MKNYYINFGMGADDFVANTIDDAMRLADEKAAYTQRHICIYEVEFENDAHLPTVNAEPVCVRKWCGMPFDDEVFDDIRPICFGHFGHYSDWEHTDAR